MNERPTDVERRGTRIIRCTCIQPYQDRTKGMRRRVHNRMENSDERRNWRCVVCGDVKA